MLRITGNEALDRLPHLMQLEVLTVVREHLLLCRSGEAVPKDPNGPPKLCIAHEGDSFQQLVGPPFDVSSLAHDPWMLFHFERPRSRPCCPPSPGPPARTGSERFGAKDRPGEVVVLISHPLVDVCPVLSQVLEVAVELVGDEEALFHVDVADGEAIGAVYIVGVDGAYVGVVHPHHLQQLIQIVPLRPDGQFGQAFSKLPESLFHAFPILPLGHAVFLPLAWNARAPEALPRAASSSSGNSSAHSRSRA